MTIRDQIPSEKSEKSYETDKKAKTASQNRQTDKNAKTANQKQANRRDQMHQMRITGRVGRVMTIRDQISSAQAEKS